MGGIFYLTYLYLFHLPVLLGVNNRDYYDWFTKKVYTNNMATHLVNGCNLSSKNALDEPFLQPSERQPFVRAIVLIVKTAKVAICKMSRNNV